MSFYTDVIQSDARFHSTSRISDMWLLEPVTRAAVEAIIADAKAAGTIIQVTETYRSQERQKMLFDQKATQLETVGVHHYGLAADFCKIVDGEASWNGDWTFLRDLAEAHGMISGLDWGTPNVKHSFVDPGHIQRCQVSEHAALFSGAWYPSDGTVTA